MKRRRREMIASLLGFPGAGLLQKSAPWTLVTKHVQFKNQQLQCCVGERSNCRYTHRFKHGRSSVSNDAETEKSNRETCMTLYKTDGLLDTLQNVSSWWKYSDIPDWLYCDTCKTLFGFSKDGHCKITIFILPPDNNGESSVSFAIFYPWKRISHLGFVICFLQCKAGYSVPVSDVFFEYQCIWASSYSENWWTVWCQGPCQGPIFSNTSWNRLHNL